MNASGGSGEISITVNRECTWDARSESPWITLAASPSGQGAANLGYTAAANPDVTSRRGSVVVNNARIDIAQTGAPCRFGLSEASSSIAAHGGALSVTVSAQATCGWTAVSQADWLRIDSPREGIGQGTVTLSVAANPGAARQGTVVIAEQSYTVSQAAAPPPECQLTVTPLAQSFAASGGEGILQISASAANCTWSATSNAAWIAISDEGANGDGAVHYMVAANGGAARTGTISVAGAVVTVTQAGTATGGCEFTVSPGAATFAVNGGDGTVQVTASAGSCAWTAVSNVPWISVTSSKGSGSGTLRYTVAANTGAARAGTLTVAGTTITVTQAAASVCQLTVSPLSASSPAAGGDGTVRIDASAGSCAWTVVSNVPWITVATASGSGGANLRYTVAANTGSARTGTLTVAGTTVTVTQAGTATVSCEFTVSPGPSSFEANGGDGTVQVTASTGSCAWTAVSNAPWISVTSSGGSGSGNVRYTVAANTGSARTGTLTVAGTTVTVTQAAVPVCQLTVSPQSASSPTAGGDGTLRIDASADTCAWNATSSVPWITVATASGSGGANLRYTVAANTGSARTGTLTVAGTTVTVTQAAAPVCQLTVSPLSASFPTAGGNGTVRIDASAGSCAWTAVSSVPWITLATGGGSGGANLGYTVAANTGAARTGTLTVAGASITVSQAAAPVAEPVELRGEISGLAGQCPNLTFTLQGRPVFTNAQTGFDVSCDKIKNRRNYAVSGLVQSDGRVLAVRVGEQ